MSQSPSISPSVSPSLSHSGSPSPGANDPVFYEGKLVETPEITRSAPDDYWGIDEPDDITIKLNNVKGEFTEKMLAEEWRNQPVRLWSWDESRPDGSQREFLVYGRITSYNRSDTLELTISPALKEKLQADYPKRVYQVSDWPETHPYIFNPDRDLGKPYPLCFGKCEKVPIIYVHCDYTNQTYDYICCHGPVKGLNAIYRNKLTLPSSESVTYTFYDGTQTTPYPGFAFIRFSGPRGEQRLPTSSDLYEITVDIDGFNFGLPDVCRNFATNIKHFLSNTTWGLGELVNEDSFSAAAAYLDSIGEPMPVEGLLSFTMISNTNPSPYVISANSEATGGQAFKAFDNSYDTEWSNSSGNSGWISIDLGTPIAITKVAISGAYLPSNSPKDFEIQYSSNNSTWLTYTSVMGMTWNKNETKEYLQPSANPYRYWRINITENNGGTNVAISDILLYAIQLQPTYEMDGHVSEQRPCRDILTDMLMAARAKIRLNINGEWEIFIDGPDSDVKGYFGSGDGKWENIKTEGINYYTTPVDNQLKKVTLKYKHNTWENEYAFIYERTVFEFGEEAEYESPFIRSHITADKWISYLQKRAIYRDPHLDITGAKEGQYLKEMDLVHVTIPREQIDSDFKVRALTRKILESDLQLIGHNNEIFVYTPAVAINVDPAANSPLTYPDFEYPDSDNYVKPYTPINIQGIEWTFIVGPGGAVTARLLGSAQKDPRELNFKKISVGIRTCDPTDTQPYQWYDAFQYVESEIFFGPFVYVDEWRIYLDFPSSTYPGGGEFEGGGGVYGYFDVAVKAVNIFGKESDWVMYKGPYTQQIPYMPVAPPDVT